MTLFSAAAFIAGFSTTTWASDKEQPFSTALAPDVKNWTAVADGFYEGVGANGENVRIYFGTAGARIKLSELKRELRQLDQQMSGRSNDEKSDWNNKHFKYLVTRIAGLSEVAEQPDDTADASKVRRDFNAYTGAFCDWNTSFGGSFTALNAPLDLPAARAHFGQFGDSTFGPLPPTTPALILREVRTSVTANGSTDSDYNYAYTNSTGPISTESATTAVNAVCTMTSDHNLRTRCETGGTILYFEVDRDQTCAGVISNTPPIVTP